MPWETGIAFGQELYKQLNLFLAYRVPLSILSLFLKLREFSSVLRYQRTTVINESFENALKMSLSVKTMRFALKYVHCRRAAGKVEDVGESRAVSLNHPPPDHSQSTHTWIVASSFQIRSRAKPTPSTPPTTPRMTASASASLGQTDEWKKKEKMIWKSQRQSQLYSYKVVKRNRNFEEKYNVDAGFNKISTKMNAWGCILWNWKIPWLEKEQIGKLEELKCSVT